MAEKKYIKLKRRVVYRGEVYNALEAERIKALENISKPYYDGYCDGLKKAIQILANDIEDIPAADVRPVVLCKDCMYAPSGTDGGEDQGFSLEWPHNEWTEYNPCPCKCEDGWYSHKPKPDFFCANGKREES